MIALAAKKQRKRARTPVRAVSEERGRVVQAYLQPDSYKQLKQLADKLHISRSAVIAQAIARFYSSEPLVGGALTA